MQVSSAKQSIQEAKTNLESKDGMHWALWVLLIILAIAGVVLLIIWLVWGINEYAFDEAGPWVCFGIGLVLLIVSILVMILCG